MDSKHDPCNPANVIKKAEWYFEVAHAQLHAQFSSMYHGTVQEWKKNPTGFQCFAFLFSKTYEKVKKSISAKLKNHSTEELIVT